MDQIITRSRSRIICRLTVDEKVGMVHAVWTGYANVAAIKDWGKSFLEVMRLYHCPYLLNDGRKSIGPWHGAIDWFDKHLVPDLVNEGLRYYAHILSENVFGQVSADILESRIGDLLEIKKFKTADAGKAWLQQMMKENQ